MRQADRRLDRRVRVDRRRSRGRSHRHPVRPLPSTVTGCFGAGQAEATSLNATFASGVTTGVFETSDGVARMEAASIEAVVAGNGASGGRG